MSLEESLNHMKFSAKLQTNHCLYNKKLGSVKLRGGRRQIHNWDKKKYRQRE